ncbi:hypothetical protein CERSUDRAFT_122028 [Gelatoporia subvermispora B]|uniref:MYND-type domain-containing protein n=1 Tax=Ceriporiopsis subvermispora (strain B) TaxID=914234 RepID=M2R5I8_CERS8|nr:hypothetical protein CERSUDRAFT_122028 [Gelatoporia subvermispora B]
MSIESMNQVRLAPHPTTRSKAVASSSLAAGSIVLSAPALSTTLLQSEKGRRCDACHRLESVSVKLLRCAGCAAYWYCGKPCQKKQWRAHHKKICKHYGQYTHSPTFLDLRPEEQIDAIMLSHLLAEAYPDNDPDTLPENNTAFSVFLDLQKHTPPTPNNPPVCPPPENPALAKQATELYLRFGNNNFIVHSHLYPYAHGIFPLASRTFNHSCVPNAVVKYIIRPSEPVCMQVVALREIQEGEEIVIPYLDPALSYAARRDALQTNYGFICSCALCVHEESTSSVSSVPERSSDECTALDMTLRKFALGDGHEIRSLPSGAEHFKSMPSELRSVWHESFLPALSEKFSSAAHEHRYQEGLFFGLTQLALYVTVYPPNYPQIGMHLLEMAKVAWDAWIVTENDKTSGIARVRVKLREDAFKYLGLASQILGIYGHEGDDDGPLQEIQVLGHFLRMG